MKAFFCRLWGHAVPIHRHEGQIEWFECPRCKEIL